ncbi:transcription factor IIIB 60 kDa subunit isoform X2 [Capsella rubella]|uniref:transcription factor IIIB 60 kDa subunit isoform X2 n=1 Tax=Capsella rubella TaxID=81985 RepID=UPI000CD4FC61|nr:transcription factor IIIB 60 kDa subunit isoform X2 [Capsella rubella]XP_023643001.1 transcription factor IIIB 60 kDa subunit isoform X2 [Capsella rubella]XP_023643002.1 transcription factor IIIB 60 kDa subunit isoform X2 [Capsella rubella]
MFPEFAPSTVVCKACDLCGRILENFNFSTDVTFVKNAAGQSQASGNIVKSVESGSSSSRERRLGIATYELRNLKDALGIGDEKEDVVRMAAKIFEMAIDQNFTKGRRTELVLSSCLYLTCREKKIPLLLIDFSSYLRVSVYELGSVYLQLCELLYLVENNNYEELVDPSIFILRFVNSLLKGVDKQRKGEFEKTVRSIISSMKRDWMQTGRKPSGICGAAIYIAALSHGIMCSRADIAKMVHMCEATITKRLNEFANTEAASLTVFKLEESEKILVDEREKILRENPITSKPNSDKGVVNCKHKDLEPFAYGLCKSCHDKFIIISGGVVGGSDPPAFQRAEKERMEKAAKEDNEGGGIEKSEGETDWDAEASDESGNLSDLDGDAEVDGCFLNEDEMIMTKISWELENRPYLEEQAAKEAALKKASEAFNANCPEYARNLVETSKASVIQSRKEKRQKRAEEARNAPPPATAMEAVCRTLERKKLSRCINYGALDELFGTSPSEKSPKKSRTETVTEKKREEKEDHEIVEDEEDEEDYAAPYEMNADEKFYEDEVEEEEDGYDFGLY